MKQQNRRRRFPIVNSSHQYRFLVIILIYIFITVGIMAVAIFVPDIIQMQNKTLSLDVQAVAANRILRLHSMVWPVIILVACFIGVHSIWVFHRFAGPLYRLNMAYCRIKEGDLGFRVTLRTKDYLHHEASDFNQMIGTLADKMINIDISSMDALKSLNELEQNIYENGGSNDAEKEILSSLRKHIDRLRETISYFKF